MTAGGRPGAAAGAGAAPAGQDRGGRGRIFWRVYGHALLLLLLVGLALAAAGWALGRTLPTREPGRLATYLAERVDQLAGRPDDLRAELERVHDVLDLHVAVYDAGGALLAASDAPPLPPAAEADRRDLGERPHRLPGPGLAFAAALPGGRGHLVLGGGSRERVLWRVAVGVAVVLLVLAAGSIPLARSIARPVERLTAAAHALGGGDLSARAGVRAPGEVGELAAAFDDMAARLEALVRGEKELLANVSHELRTPLARIRVALALAEEGDLARARQALGEIGDDLAELERLVDEILAAARLDLAGAGGLPLHRERVEPAALVEEAAQRFRAAHPARALLPRVEEGLPELAADPALLRRLLGNLLDNAAKYSEAPAPVELAARRDGGGVALEVRDHGIGIDPADLPRLFTPFFRTDRSRARGTGGVGLGLALARRIAEAHGGSIAAEAAPGGGTCFRVRLPAD